MKFKKSFIVFNLLLIVLLFTSVNLVSANSSSYNNTTQILTVHVSDTTWCPEWGNVPYIAYVSRNNINILTLWAGTHNINVSGFVGSTYTVNIFWDVIPPLLMHSASHLITAPPPPPPPPPAWLDWLHQLIIGIVSIMKSVLSLFLQPPLILLTAISMFIVIIKMLDSSLRGK